MRYNIKEAYSILNAWLAKKVIDHNNSIKNEKRGNPKNKAGYDTR
jgi:hypothetical protein